MSPPQCDRYRHQDRVPDDPRRDFQRRHAGIVHRRDPAADHGAAEPGARARDRLHRDGQTRSGQEDCGNQREPGEGDVVGDRNSGRKCQHRNVMRGPDSKAGRNRGNHEPDPPHLAAGPAHMVEQADGRERSQQAYNGRQADKPQVMLGRNTIQHSVHAVLISD